MTFMTGLGQQAFGHVASKLAEVTDNVLFGDIW